MTDDSPPEKDPHRQGRLRWEPGDEDLFVAELYIMPNLSRAARVVGFSASTVSDKRKLNPEFDARCKEALRAGWQRYKAALLSHALSAAERDVDDELSLGKVSFADAVNLLNRHAPSQREEDAPGPDIAADAEAAGASILKKIGAVKASRGDDDASAA